MKENEYDIHLVYYEDLKEVTYDMFARCNVTLFYIYFEVFHFIF